MMIRQNRFLSWLMGLGCLLLVAGCSSESDVVKDEPQPLPEGMGRIRVTICTPEHAQTRAVNAVPWEDPDHEWERLQTFRILICQASGDEYEIKSVIEGTKDDLTEVTHTTATSDETPDPSASMSSTHKSGTFTSEPLTEGTYYIFAVANFTASEYAADYDVGKTIDFYAIKQYANSSNYYIVGDVAQDAQYSLPDIHMTGWLNNTDDDGNFVSQLKPIGVSNGVETDAGTIAVWRVVGKMQLEFTNEMDNSVQIKGIEVEPLNKASNTNSGIYLFSKDNLESIHNLKAPYFSETVNQSNVTATWELHASALQADGNKSHASYISQAHLSWGYKLGSTGQIEAADAAQTKLQRFKAAEKVTGRDEEAALIFTVKPAGGLTFTPTNIAFTACRGGTDGGKFDVVAVSNGTSTLVATGVQPARYNVDPYKTSYSYSLSDLNIASTAGVFYVKIYLYNLDAGKEYAFSDVVITGNVKNTEGVVYEGITLPAGAVTDFGPVAFTPYNTANTLELGAKSSTTAEGKIYFYVNETDATFTTNENQFSLRIKLARYNNAENKWYDDELRYGMTTPYIDGSPGGDGFNVIRRNDWIHIPIHLTDWQFRVEPVAFVPIAGYPATTVSSDGLTTTFSTGGPIILQPFAQKNNDGSWRDFSDPEVEFVSLHWNNSDGTDVAGSGKIMESGFIYDNTNHRIVGVLNNDITGTHKTTITVNVKLGPPLGARYDYSFTFNVILQK